jgi:hypothetical protein
LSGSQFHILPFVEAGATRQAYEKLCNKSLDDDECADASNSLVGFFALLIEIDRDLRFTPPTDEL